MKLLQKFYALFRRGKLDAEMSAELRVHLDLQAERNRAAGMSADEAHYAAQRAFGGVEQIKELCREQQRWVWIEQAGQDVRYALRQFGRNPGFTLTAVAIL